MSRNRAKELKDLRTMINESRCYVTWQLDFGGPQDPTYTYRVINSKDSMFIVIHKKDIQRCAEIINELDLLLRR